MSKFRRTVPSAPCTGPAPQTDPPPARRASPFYPHHYHHTIRTWRSYRVPRPYDAPLWLHARKASVCAKILVATCPKAIPHSQTHPIAHPKLVENIRSLCGASIVLAWRWSEIHTWREMARMGKGSEVLRMLATLQSFSPFCSFLRISPLFLFHATT